MRKANNKKELLIKRIQKYIKYPKQVGPSSVGGGGMNVRSIAESNEIIDYLKNNTEYTRSFYEWNPYHGQVVYFVKQNGERIA